MLSANRNKVHDDLQKAAVAPHSKPKFLGITDTSTTKFFVPSTTHTLVHFLSRAGNRRLFSAIKMTQFRSEVREAVLENLKYQHSWTELEVATTETPHQLISGLPPHRIYIHPDEQVEALEIQRRTGQRPRQEAEYEWVLPLHVDETVSICTLASIFDSITTHPRDVPAVPLATGMSDWTGARRGKRILVAVVHSDSTIVYYVMHDGMVKPRQN
jgi:tRNA-splicing endonuclease subunit Sen15